MLTCYDFLAQAMAVNKNVLQIFIKYASELRAARDKLDEFKGHDSKMDISQLEQLVTLSQETAKRGDYGGLGESSRWAQVILTIVFLPMSVILHVCSLRQRGDCDEWLAHAAPEVKKLSETVNGPMFELLAKRCRLQPGDADCINMFREGALPFTSACVALLTLLLLSTGADLYTGDPHDLWRSCRESNSQLLASLREDANEDGLHELTKEDWQKSRMTRPLPASAYDLGQVRLHESLRPLGICLHDFLTWQVRCVPRFGVEQGLKVDGSKKLRAVDHFSWSYQESGKRKRAKKEVKAASVNGHYDMPCAVEHDHLDQLLAALRMHREVVGEARIST